MDRLTAALRMRIDAEGARPIVTPIFQSSAFESDSRYFYSRKDNPNVAELEQVVATLEGARHAVATTTGMAAISLATSLLVPGDLLVVNRLIYGCSFRFFDRLRARGIRVETVDLEGDAVPRGARMVFFETPTNPFLRTLDIRSVADRVRASSPAALVVVDNTWATPLFQSPLAHGADLSIHSATKFISGHSDVMGGLVLADRDDLHELLRAERFYCGSTLDPHAAWLLRRSARTLPLRMREHETVTLRMAGLLRERPEVARVFLPMIDGRQLKGYGGILFFELAEDLVDGYPTFARSLSLFDSGTGMAAVTSMVAQPWSGSHASMTDDEKLGIGLSPGLVRLCFGLETPGDLALDLIRAFEALAASRRP